MGLASSVSFLQHTLVDTRCGCVEGKMVTCALLQIAFCFTVHSAAYFLVCLRCKTRAFHVVDFDSSDFEWMMLEALTHPKNTRLTQWLA